MTPRPSAPQSTRDRSLVLWVCWLCIVSSAGAAAYVYWLYDYQQRFLARAVHVQGKIVGSSLRRGTGRTGSFHDSYTAIFSFVDRNGKSWRVYEPDSRRTSYPPTTGQACPVVYNPDNPADAQIEKPDVAADVYARVGGPAAYCVVLAISGAIGLLVDSLERRRRRPPGDGGSPPRDPAILEGP